MVEDQALIESPDDHRIPERFSFDQAEAFVTAYNAARDRGLPEDEAIQEAEHATVTPEDRLAALDK